MESFSVDRSLIPREDLEWIGHLHNEAMRETMAELRRVRLFGGDADVCRVVETALAATAKQDSRFANALAFAEKSQAFSEFKEISRIAVRRPSTRLGREIAAEIDETQCRNLVEKSTRASTRSLGDAESLAGADALGGDEPVMPLEAEAEEALQEIEDATIDFPLPAVYSSRVTAIVSNAEIVVSDSASLAVVLTAAAVADSSYTYWYTELPALALSMMDGSEPDPCTATGLRPEARREVVKGDLKGAIKGALIEAANPFNWLGGWMSAVPKIAGRAVYDGAKGSAVQSALEATWYRRKRCPQ